MAADPRQFTEHNNVGGANVYYEDKRMEELKSATGKTASQISTSAQYIPLQDVDGNLVKINPASFEEAVRNVLGSLLANNDKGTTISGIPALSGSGVNLDFGSITPANLASVLGVEANIIGFIGHLPTSNVNFNDYEETGWLSNQNAEFLIVIKYGATKILQIYYSDNTVQFRIKNGTIWPAWKTFTIS